MEYAEYKRKQEDYLRRIERFRLLDDDFFTKCFEEAPECTQLLLHVILDRADLQVEEVKVQYNIKNLQGRSVRLDVFAVDDAGKRYNIEIQRSDRGAGAKRARYNSSLLDSNILFSGEDTEELPESYVIFITEHDVLGGNKAVYHVERTIRETGSLFGDGSHILYVNGAYRDGTPIGKLMHDFACIDPDHMNYKLLADRVRYFKRTEKGVRSMCKIMEDFGREVAEEVTKQVTKQVTEQKILEHIKMLIKNLNLTLEEAMDALNIPSEDRAYYRSQI